MIYMPKVKKTQENLEKCNCSKCPSYSYCTRKKEEKLFCADEIGRSSCDLNMLGCLCCDCPVYEKNKLRSGYYCMHGSADYVDDIMNKMI